MSETDEVKSALDDARVNLHEVIGALEEAKGHDIWSKAEMSGIHQAIDDIKASLRWVNFMRDRCSKKAIQSERKKATAE